MVQPARAEGGPKSRVVRVEDEHLPLLADFIRRHWDSEATAEAVGRVRAAAAAANPGAGGEEPPTFLFLHGGRAVGHVTTLPIRLWLGGRTIQAHWVKGLMVSPEHRNGPVGFTLLKEAVGQLGTALALVVQPAPRRLFSALGFRDLGVLPNRVRAFRPGRVLAGLRSEALDLGDRPLGRLSLALLRAPLVARATGFKLRIATSVWSALAGRVPSGCRLEYGGPGAGEGDTLWSSVRGSVAAGPERDPEYLAWRYRDEDRYTIARVYERRALVGLAVVRRPKPEGDPRLGGARVAVLSDLVLPPDRGGVARAALAGAERLARRMDADALLCSASHSSLAGPSGRRGFLAVPGNVHVLARFGPGLEEPPPLGRWWLTRGDSEADEAF